jgi:hypothetical protein|tara:strand:+ start:403 stop:672 length:270 start_codon:yes stop_codon:yes gene_type:complete
MLAIFLIILFLIIFYYNNKLIGGLNNKMEILEQEISEIDFSNNEDNNINNTNDIIDNSDDYSYAISDTADLGNMYGDYSIPNITNLYIK